MTTTEARRLIRVVKKFTRSQVARKRADRMQVLVDSKIYTPDGKLTKHYR
jgi:hypothetical protein